VTPVRVVIADDHAMVRAGVRRLVEELAEVVVVGEAENGEQAMELAQRERPDIMLIDISMPGMNGLELAAWASKNLPDTRIVVLSMHAEDEYVLEALNAGAVAYLLKRSAPVELALAVRSVAAGGSYLGTAVSRQVVDAYMGLRAGGTNPPRAELTPRQREVLKLVAEGRTSRQIAAALGIGVRTVETHRAELMDRLGVRDTAGLVRYAVRRGLTGLDRG
jgi:DNA-binding NarL/FixJ family response regulator